VSGSVEGAQKRDSEWLAARVGVSHPDTPVIVLTRFGSFESSQAWSALPMRRITIFRDGMMYTRCAPAPSK
jgi:hypothetical protein